MIQSPNRNCSLCPRLKEFREKNRQLFPDKFNAPVPWFGVDDPKLLIVGLAPGLKGANFSGRPFTGDYAGELLYSTLLKFGLAKGEYKASPNDGLELINCRITNAVKCVPPENKPTGEEIKICNEFLKSELSEMKSLQTIIALGRIAHEAVIRSMGLAQKNYKFAHSATHALNERITLIDSYHCSRYNTQTKRLTEDMFHDVFHKAESYIIWI